MVLGSKITKSSKAGHRTPKQSGIVLAANHLRHGSGFGTVAGSSSSRSVSHSYVTTNSFGRKSLHQEVLHASAIQLRQVCDQAEYQQQYDSMTPAEHAQLARIHLAEDENTTEYEDNVNIDINDVLAGNNSVNVSHAGGEFSELLAIEDDLLGSSSRCVCAFLLSTFY